MKEFEFLRDSVKNIPIKSEISPFNMNDLQNYISEEV